MNECIQINFDSRHQGSDAEQGNEMLCMLLRYTPSWPPQGAWRTMNEVTLLAPGESCDFDLVDLEAWGKRGSEDERNWVWAAQ